jgi:anti-anti-sigma factor
MPIQPPVLVIDVGHVAGACVICVRGELDIAGSPAVERALKDAEASQAQRLIIDLEQLEFIDSAGLHALLDASHRSARNGNRLQITSGTGHVARMIALTGFDKVLPLVDPCLAPALPLDRTRIAISHLRPSVLVEG